MANNVEFSNEADAQLSRQWFHRHLDAQRMAWCCFCPMITLQMILYLGMFICFHPRLDNVSQTLRQMGALSGFVDFAFQIRPQNVLHHFAYLGREEALPGVRLRAVRVLQPGERRVRAVGTEAQRDARPAPDRPPAARGCGRGLKRVGVEHPWGPPRVRLAELRGVVTVSHRGRPSFLPGRGMCVIIHHDMRCFFRHRCNWWLLDVPYWFKDSFLHQVLGIISTWGEIDNFTRGGIITMRSETDANEPPKWSFTPWYLSMFRAVLFSYQFSKPPFSFVHCSAITSGTKNV